MFCKWPQIGMERLFFQLIKKKLATLDKFPLLNYHKTLNSLPFCLPPLPTKTSEKISSTNMSRGERWSVWVGEKTIRSWKNSKNFYFCTSFQSLKKFYEGLHKFFWGTTKKYEKKYFKLNFYFNTTFSEMYGAGRIKVFEKCGRYL